MCSQCTYALITILSISKGNVHTVHNSTVVFLNYEQEKHPLCDFPHILFLPACILLWTDHMWHHTHTKDCFFSCNKFNSGPFQEALSQLMAKDDKKSFTTQKTLLIYVFTQKYLIHITLSFTVFGCTCYNNSKESLRAVETNWGTSIPQGCKQKVPNSLNIIVLVLKINNVWV